MVYFAAGRWEQSQCAGIIQRVWQEEVDFYVFSSIINGWQFLLLPMSESAGIGRQARLRGVCRKAYGFKSRLSHHKTTEKSVVFIFYDITYDINIPFLRRNQLSATLFLLICKKSRCAFTVCLSTRSSRISLHQLLRAVIKKYILSMISSVAFHPISRKLPWWVAIFLLPERKYQCRQPMVWNCREISGFFILWYLS